MCFTKTDLNKSAHNSCVDENKFKQIISKGKVSNKRDFYYLWNNNLLFNKIPTWDSYSSLIESGWKGKVGIRPLTLGKKSQLNVPMNKIDEALEKIENEGTQKNNVTFLAGQPDKKILLLGELKRTEQGVYLLYSTIKKPMKDALAENENHAFGLKALIILKHNLCPQSYSDIMTLLDMFPDSSIEFTAYSTNIGLIPGRNTLIWEIRNY